MLTNPEESWVGFFLESAAREDQPETKAWVLRFYSALISSVTRAVWPSRCESHSGMKLGRVSGLEEAMESLHVSGSILSRAYPALPLYSPVAFAVTEFVK